MCTLQPSQIVKMLQYWEFIHVQLSLEVILILGLKVLIALVCFRSNGFFFLDVNFICNGRTFYGSSRKWIILFLKMWCYRYLLHNLWWFICIMVLNKFITLSWLREYFRIKLKWYSYFFFLYGKCNSIME